MYIRIYFIEGNLQFKVVSDFYTEVAFAVSELSSIDYTTCTEFLKQEMHHITS